jgi:hypothetical protein
MFRRHFLYSSALAAGSLVLPASAFAQGAKITTTDLGGATLFQGAG